MNIVKGVAYELYNWNVTLCGSTGMKCMMNREIPFRYSATMSDATFVLALAVPIHLVLR